MDVERVHINPVAPDPSTSGRYASTEDRSSSEGEERPREEKRRDDWLEISETGRRTFQAHVVPPDMDFARKALDRLPGCDDERFDQLAARIESGYYVSPVVIDQLVAHVAGAE